MRPAGSPLVNGILLVDKPTGMTSHDVVSHLRRATGMRRIGHTGTLDPAATGLLILCIGPATRLSEFLTGLEKTYEGTLRLGLTTTSYDLDGEVVNERPVPALTEDAIREAFAEFTGDIMQAPPPVSAVKIDGERSYKRARRGEDVKPEPRPVSVLAFDMLSWKTPDIAFSVQVTRGTYARSLCHDVGEKLGCGGVLAALRRTAVGKHRIEDAAPLEALADRESVQARLVPLGEALEIPSVVVNKGARQVIATGGHITSPDLRGPCPLTSGWVQIKDESGDLLALGEVQGVGQKPESAAPAFVQIMPKRVFCGDDAPRHPARGGRHAHGGAGRRAHGR